MRYLGLALFAEGPTDHRFLPPVLRRTTEELCLHHSKSAVDVGEVLSLYPPDEYRKADLATQILEAARLARGAYNILFVHTDGAGNPDLARAQRVQPVAKLIAVELAREYERTVGVVPVREMEAWTLVDGDALRAVFGISLDNSALGIPEKPRDAEKILDPKKALNDIYDRTLGRRQRRRQKVEKFFDGIGERVRLSLLRQVPAFQGFEAELNNALVELGYFGR